MFAKTSQVRWSEEQTCPRLVHRIGDLFFSMPVGSVKNLCRLASRLICSRLLSYARPGFVRCHHSATLATFHLPLGRLKGLLHQLSFVRSWDHGGLRKLVLLPRDQQSIAEGASLKPAAMVLAVGFTVPLHHIRQYGEPNGRGLMWIDIWHHYHQDPNSDPASTAWPGSNCRSHQSSRREESGFQSAPDITLGRFGTPSSNPCLC